MLEPTHCCQGSWLWIRGVSTLGNYSNRVDATQEGSVNPLSDELSGGKLYLELFG